MAIQQALSNLFSNLQLIFHYFEIREVAVGLALGITGFALAVLLWFIVRHYIPTWLTLRRITKALVSTRDYQEFKDKFGNIDRVILGSKLLKHSWAEFKETLLIPPAETLGYIQNTARPSAYLNVASIANQLHLPLYQAIPNYLVGIGLLLTFMGLVAALFFASAGVAGNVADAKVALGKLLTAATFKFLTSIAGLFSSILFSLVTKVLTSHIQRSFDRLCELLEARVVSVTPEWLAAQQLEEQRKQTIQLERFNTDFAVEVAKALEVRLNTSLGTVVRDAVAPMVSAIEGMSKNIGDANQNAMQQMISDFKSSIQGAAGAELNALAKTLETLKESLEGIVDGMNRTGGDFGAQLERAATRLDNLISGAARNMETGIADAASRLQTALSAASSSLQSDAANATSDFKEAMAQIANSLKDAVSASAGQWRSELSASAEGARAVLEKAGEAISMGADRAGQRLAEVVDPFAARLGALDSTLNVLDGRLRAQIAGFDNSINNLQAVLSGLEQTANQVRLASEPIARTADTFSRASLEVQAAASAIKNGHEQIASVVQSLLESADAIKQTWSSYRDRFEKVDADLEAVFDRIQQGTEAYHRNVIEYVRELDNHFASSVNLLGGGITELKEAVDDLVEAAGRKSHESA